MGKLVDLNKVRDKKQKRKVIMNIIFAATIIYIIYAIYLILKTPTDTITVNNGTLTTEESATGYIIRDEEVVKGKNYKNGIYQIVSEGERAAKNQKIFRYYGQNEEKIQKDIDKVNEKIQAAIAKENALFPSDVKNLEEQIDIQVQNISKTSDVKKILEHKKQISDIILKKATIAGENSKSGSYIRKLIDQREKLQNKLDKGSEYISAPKSGVVSYRVDGFENVLKADGIDELTEEKLEKLDVKTGKIIASSNESAKVINNFTIYVATVLNSTAAKQAEVGNSVKITLSNDKEIKSKIKSIKKQENNKYLVIFELNTLEEELISYRKISFNITWWNISGIKIPNDAILENENGQKYVLKKTSKGTEKVIVKILKTNEQYSIIGSYNTQDLQTLGINPSTYKEIQIHDTIMLYPKK